MNLRALAAQLLAAVLDRGESLASALPLAQQKLANPKDKALLQELAYGLMRELPKLEFYINSLVDKPLKGKQRILHYLLLVGAYQLLHTRIPAHAALAETVEAAVALKRPKFKGLVNGVLRNLQRRHEELSQALPDKAPLQYCYPSWLIKRLQTAYPDQWQAVLEQGQQRPPMWLRNNGRHQSRESYLAQLADAGIDAGAGAWGDNSIRLDKPAPVTALPGFADGRVSVQDCAAQMAAELLTPQAGELILDACAAPGGKTCHLLELADDLDLVAVDMDPKRLERVRENLARLNGEARVICGDAAEPASWWSGPQFDRILLDAPCSATGVIRRHPDIKWLRRDSDIDQLVTLQADILAACWQQLKPGGTLVYATCSILPDENARQVAAFLANTADAEHIALHDNDTPQQPGWQILPGDEMADGFYYAKLQKRQ